MDEGKSGGKGGALGDAEGEALIESIRSSIIGRDHELERAPVDPTGARSAYRGASGAAFEPPAQDVAAVDVQEEQIEMEIDKVQLVGILGAGDQSGIIITHAGASRRLQLDEEIEGWRFIGLSEDGAQFTSLGRTRVLSMEHAAPRAPAKKKTKDSAEKSAKKADKKAKDQDREKKRAQRAESRTRDNGRRDRRSPGMTSVWGGPPKQAAPEKKEDKQKTEE